MLDGSFPPEFAGVGKRPIADVPDRPYARSGILTSKGMAAMNKAPINLVARFFSAFVQYFVLTAYVAWAFGVLKYSSGANVVDARELLIYSLSFLGLAVALNSVRKKFVQRLERA